MGQTMAWIQTLTLFWLVIAFGSAALVGVLVRIAVKSALLHVSHADRIVAFVGHIFGFVFSAAAMVIFIILLPSVADWVVNVYLPKMQIWQNEFQQWITKKIPDAQARSAVGLMIGKLNFGQNFIAYVLGFGSAWIAKVLAGSFYVKKFKLPKDQSLDA